MLRRLSDKPVAACTPARRAGEQDERGEQRRPNAQQEHEQHRDHDDKAGDQTCDTVRRVL